jgi:hypothetical protein
MPTTIEPTFTNFLRRIEAKEIDFSISAETLSRLLDADIKSREGLLKWVRDRFPGDNWHYRRAEQIWADFLWWKEVKL